MPRPRRTVSGPSEGDERPEGAAVLDAELDDLAQQVVVVEPVGEADVIPPEYEEPADGVTTLARRDYASVPEFDSEDLIMPRLRLAQGLTTEVQEGDARPGDWVLNGYDAVEEVVIVPLLYAKVRAKRVADGQVECYSPNAIIGIGTPGNMCAQCPLSQWTPDPDGTLDTRGQIRNLPPRCTLAYSYYCWSVTHEAAVVVEFKRTAEAMAKGVNTLIATRGLGNFAIKLVSKRGEGRGAYHVPVATRVDVGEDTLEVARRAVNFS